MCPISRLEGSKYLVLSLIPKIFELITIYIGNWLLLVAYKTMKLTFLSVTGLNPQKN